MKLFNVLSVTVFGVLFAVGCSSTDTTSSTDGGTDTGSAVDTGVAADTGTTTDSGTTTETGSETGGGDCTTCIKTNCKAEYDTCTGDPACVAVIKCINDCGMDSMCANACVKDDTAGNEFTDLNNCGEMHCASACM